MSKSVFTSQYDRFRRLLVEARNDAGLSQAALAKKLNRPPSYPAKIELGERRLDVVEFMQYAQALGIDPVTLIKKLK